MKTSWDYTLLAKHYDKRADYPSKFIKKILKKIECHENYPVADIGAGTGKLTKHLINNKLIVHAIEPNSEMLKYGKLNTKKLIGNFNWIKSIGEKTPINNKSIYALFFGSSFNVLNYKKMLKEARRVLIYQGYMCCIWNHRDLKDNLQKNIESIIKKKLKVYKYGDRRKNYLPFFKKLKFSKNSFTLKQRFLIKISKNNFISAWKSHGTLRKNCKSNKQFIEIINEIKKLVNRKKNKSIIVPYEAVAYISKIT